MVYELSAFEAVGKEVYTVGKSTEVLVNRL